MLWFTIFPCCLNNRLTMETFAAANRSSLSEGIILSLRRKLDDGFEKPLLHTVQSAGYRIADIEQPPA